MIPFPRKPRIHAPDGDRIVTVDQLRPAAYSSSIYDGEKFPGGLGHYGAPWLDCNDYWTLRAWSNRLFTENLYARGLIRRLVTNEVNTGLTLEATPMAEMLGLTDDQATDWSDDVERRVTLWGGDPVSCDYLKQATFGGIQRQARTAALVSGDVLVVEHINRRTRQPMIQLVPGEAVQTPIYDRTKATIDEGVELDDKGRHVAYWIAQRDGTSKRLAAYGTRSGLRQAWLLYGTDRRLGQTRGVPILSLVAQSLKEMDRMRDAELRASVVNALLAMSVEKTEDRVGSKPLSGAAIRRDSIPMDIGAAPEKRDLAVNGMLPGIIIDELQFGEKIVAHNTTRPNVNYAAFEAAVLSAVAWANELPPEIFMLQFGSNYSASRAATNEFKLYLNKARSEFADGFTAPIYATWLLAAVLSGKVNAPGLAQAWRNPAQRDIAQAWTHSDWSGAIKPNVDLNKEVNGYIGMNEQGWITNDRAAKELNGTKFDTTIRRIKRENQMKADAMRPLLELQQEFGISDEDMEAISRPGFALRAVVDEHFG